MNTEVKKGKQLRTQNPTLCIHIIRCINVNICVFIVWYPFEFSRLHNIYSWYWNSLLYSLICSGENSAFAHIAAAIANYYNWIFLFDQVPITAGWTEAAWYERFARHLYMVGSMTQSPVTQPSTDWARRCLTSVIWRELVTTQPCAAIRAGIIQMISH